MTLYRQMLRFLMVGLLTATLISPAVFGQSSSSTASSSGLQSTRPLSSQPAAVTAPQPGRLEWLNSRLSEQRSPLIRSKYEGGIGQRSSDEKAANSYLKRRDELSRKLNLTETPGQTAPGQGVESEELPPSQTRPYAALPGAPDAPETEASERLETEPVVSIEPPAAPDGAEMMQGAPRALPLLPSEAHLQSQPRDRASDFLTGSAPMSSSIGYKPFEKVNEEGEIFDERLAPILSTDEEGAEGEPRPEEEEKEEVRQPLVMPIEERIPPSMVRPAVPEPRASQYQLDSQKLWSQVPVRQPQSSQFGSGVNPSQIPFEGSGVRGSGVYGGFYRAPNSDPRNPGYSYQYRGPRLYSIGESEYPTGSRYESLPYYRR